MIATIEMTPEAQTGPNPQGFDFFSRNQQPGAHDMGVPYDEQAFAAIERGFHDDEQASFAPGAVESAVETGDILALRRAVGQVILTTGQKLHDDTMLAEAVVYDLRTALLAQQMVLHERASREQLKGDDDKGDSTDSKKKSKSQSDFVTAV